VLRYATARRMKESCVACHNTHPLSPKKDWQVGDVRGVLEIIRPLDVDQQKAQAGLRGTFILIAGFSTALLIFSMLVLVLGRKARRPS
jgi:adenylate cyclase